jgi:RNA-directed DNA polymerase
MDTFRPREAWNKNRKVAFTSFLPAVSRERVTEFSRRMHDERLHKRTSQTLNDLAADINPVVAGWLAYFTAFYPTAVIPLCERIDRHLMRWAKRKFKRLNGSNRKARAWLAGIRDRDPKLFAHWKLRY